MCGDVFEGTINISKSGIAGRPIVFAAYGSGNKPVISGFQTLTAWTNAGNKIFETVVSSAGTAVNLLLVNGEPKAMGRYPNADAANNGYLIFEKSAGNVQIADNELQSSPTWKGEIVIRKNRWVIDRNKITVHSGNTINYTSETSYAADPNFGYFIQNDPATLDKEGEWYYNAASKKLGIFLALLHLHRLSLKPPYWMSWSSSIIKIT